MIMNLKILFVLLVVSSLMIACGSKKKIIEKTSIEVSKIERKKDSVIKIIKTLPIKDVINVSLKSNDRVIDSIINKKLKNFKATKTSGKNNFSVFYDTINQSLKVSATIEGSTDTKIMVKEKEKEQKDVLKKEFKQIKKSSSFNFYGWLFFIMLLVVIVIVIKLKYF